MLRNSSTVHGASPIHRKSSILIRSLLRDLVSPVSLFCDWMKSDVKEESKGRAGERYGGVEGKWTWGGGGKGLVEEGRERGQWQTLYHQEVDLLSSNSNATPCLY